MSQTESDASSAPHRQQELYWKQIVELKIVNNYVRLYRDDQSRWMNRIGILRAVASSSTIGGWIIWKDYAIVWGMILASAQLADALKDFLPNAKRQKAASELVTVLESLLIDARFEWENVFSAKRMSVEDITSRYKKLAKLQLEAEKKYFPEGIPPNPKMRVLAEKEANDYFKANYGVGAQE